ncbi:MAG: hypothetical protein PVF58_01630 [Candidatus Methanofastidiosia archaeon]|jgi:hypothetical protein
MIKECGVKCQIQKTRETCKIIKKADRIFTDFSKRMELRLIYEKALELAKKEEKMLETEYIQGKLDLLDKNFVDLSNLCTWQRKRRKSFKYLFSL